MTEKQKFKADASLREYRRDALKAARELCYGDKVISQIKNAKTDADISRIMATARKGR